jgi:hypothetical protein
LTDTESIRDTAENSGENYYKAMSCRLILD